MFNNANKEIKKLNEFQNSVYYYKIKSVYIEEDKRLSRETIEMLNLAYRRGLIEGIEKSKNIVRKINGMIEKCSYRDYYSDYDYDYDSGCGEYRINEKPNFICKFCHKIIELK